MHPLQLALEWGPANPAGLLDHHDKERRTHLPGHEADPARSTPAGRRTASALLAAPARCRNCGSCGEACTTSSTAAQVDRSGDAKRGSRIVAWTSLHCTAATGPWQEVGLHCCELVIISGCTAGY